MLIITLEVVLIILIFLLILITITNLTLSKERERNIQQLLSEQRQEQIIQRQSFDEHQLKTLKLMQDSLQKGLAETRAQVTEVLNQNVASLVKQVTTLTDNTDKHLKSISGQVDKRLSEGFEKTTTAFTDVIKRLALIDEAQKKITELSSNVVSLQEVLSDNRSRGAFGEIQLSGLIHNMLPENNFALQYTLSNEKRVDCILFLPEPTGNVAIDAKFPLENYHRLTNIKLASSEREAAKLQFKNDVKKHIQDIANKYIIPGETSDGAMMFIPAEAIFAEIHGHYPNLIEFAHKSHVWLASPTTMMAILTTARAVLKDAATRKQVHVIQEHLGVLGKDFARFQERIDKLANHIHLANQDIDDVHKSSKKLTNRFNKIEKVELTAIEN